MPRTSFYIVRGRISLQDLNYCMKLFPFFKKRFLELEQLPLAPERSQKCHSYLASVQEANTGVLPRWPLANVEMH